MKRLLLLAVTFTALVVPAAITVAQQPEKKEPVDRRYGPPKTLNDKDFFFTPPKTREAWEKRKEELRQQVLLANGLWPLPEKTPLNAVIHGKIDRDEYTIEKVFFASYPGHYVSGSLYRPKNNTGKLPAVLCPHGHFNNGRFYDAGEAAAKKELASGAEKTMESARFPLQARAAMLARLGCIVFFYDMVGYADSQKIKHREGFTDTEAELRLQSFMGLQTWNGMRALDFVLSLPDVDPTRVAMTGASGGGTQTFILGGIDDRLAAIFPAVMVGSQMQGGCVCENCTYLRIGTGNVELAGLFAPRPLGMSAADDWTINLETTALPPLKELYKLYGAEDRVDGKVWKQFKHNYNQPAREFMYNFFNKHLKLGYPEQITEKPFVPATAKELSVYDAEHPLPKDATDAAGLRKYLTAASDKQLAALKPKDEATLKEFRRVYGGALRVMVGDTWSGNTLVGQATPGVTALPAARGISFWYLAKAGSGQAIPASPAPILRQKEFTGSVAIVVNPNSAAPPVELWKQIEKNQPGTAVIGVEPYLTGKDAERAPPQIDQKYAGFTFGYNRTRLANRVDDIVNAVAYARDNLQAKKIYLVGIDNAGPWVVLARALSGDAVQRCAADLNGFRFEEITKTWDPNMLPGALKYGGMARLAALCAPGELYLHNLPAGGMGDWLPAAYEAGGAKDRLHLVQDKMPEEKVLAWLMR
jgi:dienelactone hydrolase